MFSDFVKRGSLFHPCDTTERRPVVSELLGRGEPLIGEPHRVGVVDEDRYFPGDFPLFDEGTHRLHEDEEENGKSAESERKEGFCRASLSRALFQTRRAK